jgi:hypothetical protein
MTNLTDLLPAGAGGKQVSFTADGSISSGQTVALQTDGTVTAVSGIASDIGTETNLTTSYVAAFKMLAYDSNASRGLLFRVNSGDTSGYVQVFSVSGTTATFQAVTSFASNVYTALNAWMGAASAYDSNAQKILIVYSDAANSFYGTARVATISGNSVSFGTAVVFESQQATHMAATYDSNAQKVVVFYGATDGYGIVATISGTSVSFGTRTQYVSGFPTYVQATFDSNNNKTVVGFVRAASGYASAVVGTVSGTSISFGSYSEAGTATSTFLDIEYDVTSQKTLLAWKESNTLKTSVGTISGTSISFGTPVSSSQNSPRDISLAYDATLQKVVLSSGQSPVNAYVITVSGTSLTYSDAQRLSVDNIGYYNNSVYVPDAGKEISVFTASSGNEINYIVYQVGETNSDNFIGIADAAISDTASGNITIKGGVASNTDISTPLVTTVNDDAYWMTTGAPQAIAQVYDPDSSKFVVMGREGNIPRAFVGTVSGTSISYGSVVYPGGLINGGFFNQSLTYDTNADKLVFCYQNNSNSGYGTAVVGSISGTTTTWGTPVVYASVSAAFNEVVYDSNAQKVAVVYKNQSSSNQGVAIVGTVSGTSISFGSSVDFLSAGGANANDFALAYDTNAQKIFVAATDFTNSLGLAYVATISGTSISFGTPTTFLSDVVAGNSLAAAYDSTNQKCVLAYTNETTDLGYIVVGTISGTSVSFGSATQYAVGLSDKPNINCMAYNPTSQLMNIVYNMPSGADDGIRTTFVSISGTTVTVESDVSLKTGGNTEMSGNLYDPDTGNIIVFYNDPSVSDAVSNVLTTSTTLVPNSTYYVQSDGTLSTTSSSVTAGKALSATSINLDYSS